ncbi:hypothetical protein Adt_45320 [Abeliophyllum distichum]|uniref:Uncharacterized protein n=1 Tax=Abeliophyllum distichum TaxID=126358 RepID=A0ABD1PDC8_9LAMI
MAARENHFSQIGGRGSKGSLEASEKGWKEAKAKIARLLCKKKEMERKLESVKVEYMANFHNTKAYTNFSNYFAKVGHHEVLAVLWFEHLDLNIGFLEDRFPQPDAEGEEDT